MKKQKLEWLDWDIMAENCRNFVEKSRDEIKAQKKNIIVNTELMKFAISRRDSLPKPPSPKLKPRPEIG